MEDIPKITRSVFMEAIHAAFSDPACARRGGLKVEVHIGCKQAVELGIEPDKAKGPWIINGQPVYLINSPSHFKVMPAGSFKKGKTHAV